MRSLIIGIARPGSPNDYVLNRDTRYISMCGNKPEMSFSVDCGQHQFIEIVDELRYSEADPSSSAGAISFFQDLITKVFADMKYLTVEEHDDTPLHIRLVTTPFELAQLPFEFVLAPANIAEGQKLPLLALPNRMITLTREVRQESESGYAWPTKPRILFAWAQPGVPEMSVPHHEHLALLRDLVASKAKPKKAQANPEPFFEELLTELPNASIEAIKAKIDEGITQQKPYTHIHILAHGGEKDISGVTDFQLVLCKNGQNDAPQKINGKKLARSLIPTDHASYPTVVSLAVCDSAHVGNTILPSGSLVYQLHTAGIPCVFASQFPLTQAGSITMAKTLYQQLLNNCDPRAALYETRIELKKDPTHDWASLVAYARFPEDINEQLQTAKLKTLFGSMKITNEWVDHVFKFWGQIDQDKKETALQEIEGRLKRSIDDLSDFLKPENSKESTLANELLQAEHFGLLGSAYKRQAEYLFRSTEFHPENEREPRKRSSLAALNSGKEFYACGLEANPANHWAAMQYLSLKAVTEGSLKDEQDIWSLIKLMSERSERRVGRKGNTMEDKMWAWGTLGELYLLRPLLYSGTAIGEDIEPSVTRSIEYIQKLADADAKYDSAKESTVRQLERYIKWWPDLFGEHYPGWLKDSATRVRNILPPLEDLLPGN